MSDESEHLIEQAELDAWIKSLPCKWPDCQCIELGFNCLAEAPSVSRPNGGAHD